jgi:hypothetical protein
VAGNGGGESGDEEVPRLDKAGMADAGGGHDAPVRSDQGDAEAPPMEREDNEELRVWLGITPRRVRIDPRKKRADYIKRLEQLMRECDRVISDPQGYEEIQVKAMAILIRAILVCYKLVTDEQVEALEEEFEALKRRIAERDRADKAGA